MASEPQKAAFLDQHARQKSSGRLSELQVTLSRPTHACPFGSITCNAATAVQQVLVFWTSKPTSDDEQSKLCPLHCTPLHCSPSTPGIQRDLREAQGTIRMCQACKPVGFSPYRPLVVSKSFHIHEVVCLQDYLRG